MTLQNVRALMWRGEDLGYGGGNTREVITSTTVAASARPLLVTLAFTTTLDISAYLPKAVITGTPGQTRAIMNRSPRYFITLTARYAGALIQIPIAPLQVFYLPNLITGPGSLTINSLWPIPVPLSGASGVSLPIATGMTALTVDILVEN